jgi:hypothetical protein
MQYYCNFCLPRNAEKKVISLLDFDETKLVEFNNIVLNLLTGFTKFLIKKRVEEIEKKMKFNFSFQKYLDASVQDDRTADPLTYGSHVTDDEFFNHHPFFRVVPHG